MRSNPAGRYMGSRTVLIRAVAAAASVFDANAAASLLTSDRQVVLRFSCGDCCDKP